MPRSDYDLYAAELGLTELFDTMKHEDIKSVINIGVGDAPAWWNPPSASTSTYFKHVKGCDYLQALNYKDGTACLIILSW